LQGRNKRPTLRSTAYEGEGRAITPLISRRALFRLGVLAAVEEAAAFSRAAEEPRGGRKVVLLTIGGIRRQESFSAEGAVHIPRLYKDLLPRALFYPFTLNEGVTSHVNTISSILTGAWQQIDDWGASTPAQPTLLSYYRSGRGASPAETWMVTSNKAVTRNVAPGANVVLAKQLMIEAVERIILGQTARRLLTRSQVHEEMKSILLAEYRRIGWDLPSDNPRVTSTLLAGIEEFFNSPGGRADGDELTFLVAREVMRRLAPAIVVINFSGVEVAHSGTYSLHLAGIRNCDSLAGRLWEFLEADPRYKGRTTFIVMPEFGRDPDGSSTNGFFNHRTDTKVCRLSWMMVLGEAVRAPRIEERVIRQIDLAPTLGALLGVDCPRSQGRRLEEFAV
jgi:hypothetical protein